MADFACDLCPAVLKTASGLAGHKQLKHPAQAAVSGSAEASLGDKLSGVKQSYEQLSAKVEALSQDLANISKFQQEVGGKDMETVVTTKDLEIRDLKVELAELKKAKDLEIRDLKAELARAEKAKPELSNKEITEALRQHLAECPACRKAAIEAMPPEERKAVITEYAEAMGIAPKKIVIKGSATSDLSQTCAKCGKPMSKHRTVNDLVFGASLRCPGAIC